MKALVVALLVFGGLQVQAKDKKMAPKGRTPSTQGEYSECRGILAEKTQFTLFTQTVNFAAVEQGQEIEVFGEIVIGDLQASSAKLKIKRALPVPRLTPPAAQPAKGSGWNDIVVSSTTVSASMNVNGQEHEDALLFCDSHNRTRY